MADEKAILPGLEEPRYCDFGLSANERWMQPSRGFGITASEAQPGTINVVDGVISQRRAVPKIMAAGQPPLPMHVTTWPMKK
ncbi:MAG: hypothetical protein U0Z17_07455 [Bacteroidales bacterium]